MGKSLISAGGSSKKPIELPYCRVYYAGSGDTSFTSAPIKFNTVITDNYSAYSTSTGKYCVPIDGLYEVVVNYYSNSPTSSARPTIFHTNASGTTISDHSVEHNQQSCASISDIFSCKAGDYLYFGPYASSYPINFYAAQIHNSMCIAMLNGYETTSYTSSLNNNIVLSYPNYSSKVAMGLPTNPTSASTTTFTCPDNGWISIVADRGSSAGNTIYIVINGTTVTLFPAHFAYYVGQAFLPVRKNDIILLKTDSTSTTWTVRQQDFYYSY